MTLQVSSLIDSLNPSLAPPQARSAGVITDWRYQVLAYYDIKRIEFKLTSIRYHTYREACPVP